MSNNHAPLKEITLQVSIEEANTILEALGQMPFVKVYALINKIQEQAGQQVNASSNMSAHDASREDKRE